MKSEDSELLKMLFKKMLSENEYEVLIEALEDKDL